MVKQRDECSDRVHDVTEAPALLAVSVHGEVVSLERLTHEPGQDHPELARLTRADAIEQARDDRGDAAVAPVRAGEDLIDRLARGVRPARLERGPQDPIGVLM